MSKKSITFGTHFTNFPNFEVKLQKSQRLLMYGHYVTDLSKEELLVCIVTVQEECDALRAQNKKFEELIAKHQNF